MNKIFKSFSRELITQMAREYIADAIANGLETGIDGSGSIIFEDPKLLVHNIAQFSSSRDLEFNRGVINSNFMYEVFHVEPEAVYEIDGKR